jgi:hypothetical protein
MKRLHAITGRWIAVATVVLLLTPAAVGGTPPDDVLEILADAEMALELRELSEAVWPDWDISETPLAVTVGSDRCYLLHHPDPPSSFSKLDERLPRSTTVYEGPFGSADVKPASGTVRNQPTGFAHVDQVSREAVPAVFAGAFRAHELGHCPELGETIDLMVSFPSDARNLALVDVECDLLRRALTAPADSLEKRVIEFVSVRAVRRLGMGKNFVSYERQREFLDGLPAYIGERCREIGASYLRGDAGERLRDELGTAGGLEHCFPDKANLDWYRSERFMWSGACICMILDRYHPEWREEVAERCVDPFEVLFDLTKRKTVRTKGLLERYGLEERLVDRAEFIDATKSAPEKLFESVASSEKPLLIFNVRMLASASVSYDPENVETVDAHRTVHKRVLKIEYSAGTRIELIGRPVAAVVGEDEFDFSQLLLEAPEGGITVTVQGEPLELTGGIHQIDRPFEVEGAGVRVVAQSGAIMVGDGKTTIVLHR